MKKQLLPGIIAFILSLAAVGVAETTNTRLTPLPVLSNAGHERVVSASEIYLPLMSNPVFAALPGRWLSPVKIMDLPTAGPAWSNVWDAAQQNTSAPDASDQDDKTNVYMLAKALVYARTGQIRYRDEVAAAIAAVMGTEGDGSSGILAIARNIQSYVLAADLINLAATNPALNADFRNWLVTIRAAEFGDDNVLSIVTCHEKRPNNIGNHCGATRVAIALYLGDTADLDRAATVFKGYLGDRSAYAGFSYGDLWWQCDPANPVGINPAGCTINGHSVDGVLPDDQRRGGAFTWPPPQENYAWGGLQGAIVQAQLLHRAGYPAWEWEDKALLRAVTWLHEQANYPAEGDDAWQPWLINAAYGTTFPAETPAGPGKAMGWTDWTAAIQP